MAMVLVVDDRLVNRELVRTVLGHYGHDTLEAGDGVEALTLLGRQRPDLVLTDVVMPGMDGYQLANAIRSDPASRGIPVLFYTAADMAGNARPIGAAHGVSRIVAKTGDLDALIEAVEDALSGVCGEPARLDPHVGRGSTARRGRPAEAALQAQPASEDPDLRTSLAALSHLATGQMELRDVLTRVAELAVSTIPGADGAGLTLLEAGHADTIVASTPFVAEVDAIQHATEEGPCITAAAQARTLRSGELDTDPRWPRFGPRMGHLGVHSVVSMPLLTHPGVLGAMTVYGHQRAAFDDDGVRIGELFAVSAAIAVQNAQVLAQTKRLATPLQGALTNRAAIDQAIGILMSRFGCSPDEACDRLRQTSRSENQKLHSIASRIVERAVRLARAGYAHR